MMLKKTKLQQVREGMLLSKGELARMAGISSQTIDRIEKGNLCRIDIKRRLLLALGCSTEDYERVFD